MASPIPIVDITTRWAEQRELPLISTLETKSTNDDAKARAISDPAPLALYLTAHQTAGRGRGHNHWLDTGAGESFLSTWSWAVAHPPQPIAAPRVGLALYRSVRGVWPSLKWSLKAPNDLILAGRKCAGLLLESVTHGEGHRLLVGLGFNILNHPRKFTEATHLGAELAEPLTEGQWFQFLDTWKSEMEAAVIESTRPQLSPLVCQELAHALNAHPQRRFEIQSVTPAGDLIHAGGVISWLEV